MIYLLIVSNILMIAAFFLRLNTLPPQIPLFYSHPWGEAQLADTWMILILPLIANLLFFLNGYIYKRFFPEDQVAKKIMEFLNIFIIVSFTAIFIRIIFLIS